ncbi:hypothetical protein NU08_2008 [Flavobacterium anhuiense]|uniref:Uncharacterized protein n=1 Tax=Flavobacterium anhuiense TaxID=459526 RepID=A0A444VZU8_9FLAO|nr:hypothetical protein NU08_2008 [Flavobacterium anhuiense]
MSIGQTYPKSIYYFVNFLNQCFDFEGITSFLLNFIGFNSGFQTNQYALIFNSNFNN